MTPARGDVRNPRLSRPVGSRQMNATRRGAVDAEKAYAPLSRPERRRRRERRRWAAALIMGAIVFALVALFGHRDAHLRANVRISNPAAVHGR